MIAPAVRIQAGLSLEGRLTGRWIRRRLRSGASRPPFGAAVQRLVRRQEARRGWW